jgi:hypothetical protein
MTITSEFRRDECPNFEACGYCPKHRHDDLCPLLLEFFSIAMRYPPSRLNGETNRGNAV